MSRSQLMAAVTAVAMVAILNRTDFGKQLLG